MFLQRPITMWTATAKVLKGREREKIKVVQRYVTMRRWRMTRKGKGNKRSHRQEIRRARLSNTFSFFFPVLCNKHCTLHIRLRSLVFNSSSLLKIDQLACTTALSTFKSYVHSSTNSLRQAKQQIRYKKKRKKNLSPTPRRGRMTSLTS